MEDNSSMVGGGSSLRWINHKVLIVQILVMIFLCINCLLIVTFFQKECFYTTARYILFVVTLVSYSLLLFISDILLLMTVFHLTLQMWSCIIISVVVLLYLTVTPVTAMTLERYVAVCLPLRHGELCSTRNTVHCILIIHVLSFVPCIVVLLTFFATAPLSFYRHYRACYMESFMLYKWQDHVRSAVHQFYFFYMCITIVISNVKIMKVAKDASGEDKQSSKKGLRTVVLHGLQLLLCLMQLWRPLIEAALNSYESFVNFRYPSYILFNLAPRCLSPLIYGLRDEMFFHALKNYVFCGLFNRNICTFLCSTFTQVLSVHKMPGEVKATQPFSQQTAVHVVKH